MNGDRRIININEDQETDENGLNQEPDSASTVDNSVEVDWQAEAERQRDLFLRCQADMDNMKKRLEKEKIDFIKFANEALVKDLLQVVDNLERALGHAQPGNGDQGGLADGVKLTLDGLLSILDKHGVKPVSALSQQFDPHFHEAVMQREDPDVEGNTVLQEVQRGYLLNERLIRPAMVIVSRRPSEDSDNN
jgi:molecular chaperone GrpE